MKTPQGATTASIRVDGGTTTSNQSIGSSVDMFYTLANKAESETTYTVQITNTGQKILSITELKICDDPNAAFVPFTAEEILAAAQEQILEKYAFVDESSVADTEVVYGEVQELNVQIGKVATLKITFVNLRGNKQGTSTIEVVQTADGYCRIAASEIKDLAPARQRAIWFTPVYVFYGSTDSIVVPVI